MKAKRLLIPMIFLLLSSLLFSDQKIKEKDLSQKNKDWLKLTEYIIHKEEKEVFMQLTNDRERDIFIETFWKQRDPTSGTPKNEFKEEHKKRFLYANKNLGRNTPREGWMTDMGRIYIILGPAISIDRIEAARGILPVHIWSYYGDTEKGLPVYFSLAFFQRGGHGEYELYDPVSDGPISLMEDTMDLDPYDYQALYEKIMDVAPALALVSLSVIPGEIPFNFQPSLRTPIIMAYIEESAKKNVSSTYATHFLNYKGIVSTEYLTNYVENETSIALIQDPVMGINFLHFSIAPESISIDYYEPRDQYYCNYKIDVSLRIEDNLIFQYSKDFPLYFPPEDLIKIQGKGISIEDSFPIIAGRYKLNILLQNSVGKEFSTFEKEIFIPEESELPQIFGPFMGYKFKDYKNDIHIPFKVVDKKLVVDPKNIFSTSDSVSFFFLFANVDRSLWNEGKIEMLINGLKEINPSKKSFSFRLKNYPHRKILSITHTIPAEELSPDYYEIELRLIDKNGNPIDEKSNQFIISSKEEIAHPFAHAKAFPLSNSFVYFYMLAHQHDRVNKHDKALANYKKAYELNPNYKKGLIEYANFLFKIKMFDKSLELIENIKEDEKLKFEYYMIKGKAYMGQGRYSEGIENLLEGNKIYNSDTALLNSLGFCYYKTGEKKKALGALKSSLSLNSEQKEIKKLIEIIEKSQD